MDSMRSLNSSLPSSRPNGTTPPDLLQAFRTAALSVTNLYKSAAADQASSRQAGYQDALEDLLKFLDQENLGLQDGEGWRIRQWATQHYDGGSYQHYSDDDADIEHDIRQSSSSSNEGVAQHQVGVVDTRQQDDGEHETHKHEESAPQSPTVFQFTGADSSRSLVEGNEPSSPQIINENASSSSPIRVEVMNRNKAMLRQSSGRQSTRSNPRDFTFTAGTKRKLHFPDFFDISNMPDRRDGSGGSKKGRMA